MQAEGKFDEYEFYFRARGQHWSIELTDPETGAEIFQMRVKYDKPGDFAAGWMDSQEAFLLIVSNYFKWKRNLIQ